jgi:hypothetical protein
MQGSSPYAIASPVSLSRITLYRGVRQLTVQALLMHRGGSRLCGQEQECRRRSSLSRPHRVRCRRSANRATGMLTQSCHDRGQDLHEQIHLLRRIATAEAETDSPLQPLGREAHGDEDM